MLTPKEVQEITFDKALRGYDMKSVDDFLDTLSENYISLYNENASLKSKLRVLVAKIEEYRNKESALNQAQIQAAAMMADAERKVSLPENVAAAQAQGEEILSGAEEKQAEILAAAQAQAEALVAEAQAKAAKLEADAQAKVDALGAEAREIREKAAALTTEEQRVENARRVAQNFIAAVEEAVGKHLDLLEDIRKLDPTPANRPYDYESEADPAAPVTDAEIEEIARNVKRFYESGEEADEATRVHVPEESSIPAVPERFADLQFGPGYDPRA